MQVLESNMKEILAENEAALERLLTSFEKLRVGMCQAIFGAIVSSLTILGGFVVLLEFLLRTP